MSTPKNYLNAITALVPVGTDWYYTNEEGLVWRDESVTQPTEEAINTKIAELDAEDIATQYQADRAEAYPSIQEQLDMQYWDSVNGTTTWADAIAQVKADNPKPE